MNHRKMRFDLLFEALTGHEPLPWQQRLYDRFIGEPPGENIPEEAHIPTGLGKTSVIAIWLIALARHPEKMPRRLVYVVNRRTVVDQTTTEVENLRLKLLDPRKHAAKPEYAENLESLKESLARLCGMDTSVPLAISTLRGQFADNQEWSADPSRPAVICGTVDLIGSRLLFEGYRIGFKSRPMHAGFLGQDALLVHDEAHLEPAFQTLIKTISAEQRDHEKTENLPWSKLFIMALSATTRSDLRSGAPILTLTTEDEEHSVVKRRIESRKQLHLHEYTNEKADLAGRVADLSVKHEESGNTVLIFVRLVDDVVNIIERLAKSGVERDRIETLTGTMRGYERDQLVRSNSVFARFMPAGDRPADLTPAEGTVYLICTSAGEVGVNISADHMVCDLSTLDSMIQRLGRVNRFGDRDDTRVDVVYPTKFDDKKPGPQRMVTLDLLGKLPEVEPRVYDASPKALGDLPANERLAAFAPEPTILPATDILFDAWALTTIRDKMPGRPPVAPYLHGVAEWEPPRTSVAWREEVDVVTDELIEREGKGFPQELLADYPLKPHELLSDRTDRVYTTFAALIAEPKKSVKGEKRQAALTRAQRNADANIWLIDDSGSVTPTSLGEVLKDDKKRVIDRLADSIILLAPRIGVMTTQGMLDSDAEHDPSHPHGYDIADYWLDEHQQRRRHRAFSDVPRPTDGREGMALIRTIDIDPLAEERAQPDQEIDADVESEFEAMSEALSRRRRFWHWYARPRDAEDATRASIRPITWQHHTNDVVERAKQIVNGLMLSDELKQAATVAAELHDLGKQREIWQRSIGNPNPVEPNWYAKPGKPDGEPRWRPRFLSDYRHEFGSLLDTLHVNGELTAKLAELSDEMQDVVLHLIAAHHGYARPHFPPDAYDHERYNTQQNQDAALEVIRRYARLQRRYGRWGLAYLESLLRAADWTASAIPSPIDTGQEVS